METHDLGRLYWHTQDRDTRLPVQIARSQMTEEPYRRGLGLALAPFTTHALVVGYWGRKTGPLGIRVIGDATEEVREWDSRGPGSDAFPTSPDIIDYDDPVWSCALPWDRLHGVPRVHLGETFADVAEDSYDPYDDAGR